MVSAPSLLRDVCGGFVRRALIYPYLRRWDVALACLADAGALLQLGRRGVLRALLAVRARFSAADPGYLLNTLFIEDYCVWVQGGVSDGELCVVGRAVVALLLQKPALPQSSLLGATGIAAGEGAAPAGVDDLLPLSVADPAFAHWNLGAIEASAGDDSAEEVEEEEEVGSSSDESSTTDDDEEEEEGEESDSAESHSAHHSDVDTGGDNDERETTVGPQPEVSLEEQRAQHAVSDVSPAKGLCL